MRMSEESKARQRAANAQSDNIVDTDRTHHDGIPRDPEIESDPKAINRNERTAAVPEAATNKAQTLKDQEFHSGGGSRGVKGWTGSGKGPLDHQNPNPNV